jgi:sugar phosphate isomerase/epimerase
MAEKFGRLALHTWTIDTTPLPEALAAARDGGFDAVELRRIDFRRCYAKGMSNDAVLDLIRKSGIAVDVLGVEYGCLFASGDESAALFDDLHVSCRNAVALGCGMLMSAPGPQVGPLSEAIVHLRRMADIAAEYGLKVAIEFNSQHKVLNSLETQSELVRGAAKANAGRLLDAYHLARSGRPGRGFAEVPSEEIFCFQYSDLSKTPVTGLARPTDRLPPGQGVIAWRDVFGLLAEKAYTGHLSYEAPNPVLWERPALDVCREGVMLTKRFVAAAVGADNPLP